MLGKITTGVKCCYSFTKQILHIDLQPLQQIPTTRPPEKHVHTADKNPIFVMACQHWCHNNDTGKWLSGPTTRCSELVVTIQNLQKLQLNSFGVDFLIGLRPHPHEARTYLLSSFYKKSINTASSEETICNLNRCMHVALSFCNRDTLQDLEHMHKHCLCLKFINMSWRHSHLKLFFRHFEYLKWSQKN